MRTLRELRDGLKGQIFVYLKDRKTIQKFAEDATVGGFKLNGKKPIDVVDEIGNIMSVHKKELTFPGFVGHMQFQAAPNSDHFAKVDYDKYINVGTNYFMNGKDDSFTAMDFKIDDKSYEIVGDKSAEAIVFVKANVNELGKEEAIKTAEEKYDVIILPPDED